jgi:hypothetical protein
MKFSFLQFSAFHTNWKSLGLSDDDLRFLQWAISSDPTGPPVISGTGGMRKIRFASKKSGSGKSSGVRVCYACYPQYELIYLCAVFAKNEQANLTNAERADYKAVLKRIDERLNEFWKKGMTP